MTVWLLLEAVFRAVGCLLICSLLLLPWPYSGFCSSVLETTIIRRELDANATVIPLNRGLSNHPTGGEITSPGFGSDNFVDPGRYVVRFVTVDHPVCLRLVFTDFLLEASADKSGTHCEGQDSHLQITNGANSSIYCGLDRPRPQLSFVHQCLTLELIVTDPSRQIALLRAEFGLLADNECWQSEATAGLSSPPAFVQRTDLLTSDINHLGASIHWVPGMSDATVAFDFLWYIRLKEGSYMIFTLEEFQTHDNATLEIRDGATTLSPLVFSSESSAGINPKLVSTSGALALVRWSGMASNSSNINMYYSSIQSLSKGPQADDVCRCQNNGICVRDGASRKCFCTDGFVGKKCQISVKGKAHHLAAVIPRCTCRNGGTCTPTSTGFGFVCSCPAGFSGFDCALNSTSFTSTSAEYGIAMGAAVVAVLLVMFGIALCMCVILQYIRQQREGPEGNYRPALSRDVYSVEGVNISSILRIESLEANNYIPPSYSQCVHSTPTSPVESEVFLSPSHSNQSVRAWHKQVQRVQRTPDSPPPTYDAIIGICRQCSQMRKGGGRFKVMKSLGSEPALIRYTRGQGQPLFSEQRPSNSVPTTPQDCIEMREVR